MQKKNDHHADVLIVDDKPDNLRFLSKMLSERGYNVRPAPSGSYAHLTIKQKIPDLILLDVMMPEIDGYEVCRTLKADERTRDIPVLFLSALNKVEDKIAGFEAGGLDFITKPFHEKEVVRRVETHLKISRLQQKLHAEAARFKSLTDASIDGIIIHDNGVIKDVNPVAARLFQRQEAELIGADLKALFPSEILNSIISSQLTGFECEISRKDNSRLSVEIHTKQFAMKDEQVISIRDLTHQKKIEQQRQALLIENSTLIASLQDRYKFGRFVGRSAVMQEVYGLITKAAAAQFPVVIYGESGTGKELAAQMIHTLGLRKDKPFITVNCGAITESLFEREFFGHRRGAFTGAERDNPGFLDAAHNGTIFFDELGELSLAMQVKLLRVLQSGEYTPVGDVAVKKADVRIIVATNKDLADLVHQGKFRQDLFFRINVVEITMPPLRERREDIRLLVEHALSQHGTGDKMVHLPAKFREMLHHHDWPGNVRELINTIQRFLATDSFTLPGKSHEGSEEEQSSEAGLQASLEALELRLIVNALHRTNWHRKKTAELLQIPRRSLQRKMKKYDLRSDDLSE